MFEGNRPASREGDGEKEEKGGSGKFGRFSELCDIDTESVEQKMWFWQSVAVD